MIEIVPGIHQLKIPIPDNPLGYTNSYLVQGDGEYLLIDPGINNDAAFDALQKELTEVGVAFENITRILVTHSHNDHYGLCGRVKQLSHAKILVHHIARDAIQQMQSTAEERWPQSEQWLRLNGVPGQELAKIKKDTHGTSGSTTPTLPDITLQDDETIVIGSFNLKVVWTPGHSPGHICLYEPAQKILFSGDHVLPVITPHVNVQTQSDVNPLADFINSLNKVEQLDVSLILPAHEHLFHDLPARVREIIEHHEYRNSEIMATIKTRSKTAYQISTKITWMPTLGGVPFRDLEPKDKRMAVLETLAHLETMRVNGRVDKSPEDGIVYYRRA
jgi:glyoxylase-like metal-dependent hydrolase (beta-lactamase superfamily II)